MHPRHRYDGRYQRLRVVDAEVGVDQHQADLLLQLGHRGHRGSEELPVHGLHLRQVHQFPVPECVPVVEGVGRPLEEVHAGRHGQVEGVDVGRVDLVANDVVRPRRHAEGRHCHHGRVAELFDEAEDAVLEDDLDYDEVEDDPVGRHVRQRPGAPGLEDLGARLEAPPEGDPHALQLGHRPQVVEAEVVRGRGFFPLVHVLDDHVRVVGRGLLLRVGAEDGHLVAPGGQLQHQRPVPEVVATRRYSQQRQDASGVRQRRRRHQQQQQQRPLHHLRIYWKTDGHFSDLYFSLKKRSM